VGQVVNGLVEANGILFALPSTSALLVSSIDDGLTWTAQPGTAFATTILDITEYQETDGLWAVGGSAITNGEIYEGSETGTTWSLKYTNGAAGQIFTSMVRFSGNGRYYAAENGDIYISPERVTVGNSGTCQDGAYFANKAGLA